jgi:enoyl-CoA hydratase/carnithine racemase
MSHAYKHLSVNRESPAAWRATFDHPPINLVDPDTLRDLRALVSEMEEAPDLKVVVFDSADPEFFLAHWDVTAPRPETDPPDWIDIAQRFARVPVVSIAKIRGRARGIGSEITLAFDMRFASLERAIFGQPEVGVGLLPGGGAMERLPPLVGRARALEIVLGADDFDAATAERYGWINRALPDAALGAFVRNLAERIASFDKQALAEAKGLLNRNTLVTNDALMESQASFYRAFSWPGTQARAQQAMALGLNRRSDLEMRLGAHLPALGPKQG